VTAEKDKEKYLSSTSCILEKFNWINGIAKNNVNVLIRFRHRQTLIPGKLKINADHTITLVYKPTLSVTCGQFAVVYQKNICLGGGIVISYKKS
jgi:tRNA-specific 2-thiouridylase